MRICPKSTSAFRTYVAFTRSSHKNRSSEDNSRSKPFQHGPSNAICGAQPAVCEGLDKACEEVYQARQKRILKDCNGHSDRVCYHGLHWFLCQTHPHPHQQHHCWWLNISPD